MDGTGVWPSERNTVIILSTTRYSLSIASTFLSMFNPHIILFRGHTAQRREVTCPESNRQKTRSGALAPHCIFPQGVGSGPPGAIGAAQVANRLHPLEPPGQPLLRAAPW